MQSVKKRIQIWSHFRLADVVLLVAGKIFPSFRSSEFKKLQEKENSLTIAFNSSSSAVLKNDIVQLTFPFSDRDLKLELRTSGSDILVFQQIFLHQSYNDALRVYEEFFKHKPLRIVDAGANIGLASLYFATLCPQSKILAIEPDEENATSARRNFSQNNVSSITLRRAALWPNSSHLTVLNDFRDGANWSLRVEESSEGGISAITPPQAVDYFDGVVDLFKIDIEGAEAQIFKEHGDLSWLKAVKVVAIEIHEENIEPKVIIEIFRHFGFHVREAGELTIGINSSFLENKQSNDSWEPTH